MTLELKIRSPYDFAQSVRDHGWIALAPCTWLPDHSLMRRVERLSSGKVAVLHITSRDVGDNVHISVDVQADGRLKRAEQQELVRSVAWMLKLDEDFSEFYASCSADAVLAARVGTGRGRLLRSPTLWEDVVKTICTTNTTWTQTKGMVQRIVHVLGDPYIPDPALRAFPTPEQVVAGAAHFQDQIRLGYRNEYVIGLAREIVEGRRDLEALRDKTLPVDEARKALRSIKGVGDYAASTLLMILGYYDRLALDSELRSFVTKKYFNGQRPTDREIAAIYEPWGKWKYLAYWFDAM